MFSASLTGSEAESKAPDMSAGSRCRSDGETPRGMCAPLSTQEEKKHRQQNVLCVMSIFMHVFVKSEYLRLAADSSVRIPSLKVNVWFLDTTQEDRKTRKTANKNTILK